MAHKIFVIALVISITFGIIQAENEFESAINTQRPVNLFIIVEEGSKLINKSLSTALESIAENAPGSLGFTTIVYINGANSTKDIDKLCLHWDSTLKNGSSASPDLALDLTRSSSSSEIALVFTAAVGVPTFAARYGDIEDLRNAKKLPADHKKYLLQIKPPADSVPMAIRQLCAEMNISNAAIIFDDDFVMDHKYKSLLLNIPTRHVIVKAKVRNEMKGQLKQLRSLDIVNFFILGNHETINNYMSTAQDLNYTGRKYGWYSFTLDYGFNPKCMCRNFTLLSFEPKMLDTDSQRTELDKKLLMKPVLMSSFYHDFILLGFEAMRLAIDNNLWPSKPVHITTDEYHNSSSTPKRDFDFSAMMQQTISNPNFKPLWANFEWNSDNVHHHTSFKMNMRMINITNYNKIRTKNVGEWEVGSDMLKIEEDHRAIVINNTAVTSFRVVTIQVAPFVQYNNVTGIWSGYCVDLLEKIKAMLKFEYEIYEAPDGKFGAMNETDFTWNGMIGELTKKKADIAIGTLSVMAERENVVDFTVPYYDLVGLAILMAKPKAPTSLFKFLTVLENEVWLYILAIYFTSSIFMWIFDRWSPWSYKNNQEKYENDEEKRAFDLKECLWFCMTSLTPQGGGDSPKNLSGRLIAATWWLFGFIIIASYTANLAAFLTVSRLETPVESLDDLSRQYKIQYAPIIPSEAYTYFERMANIEKRFYEIWKDKSLNDNLSHNEKAAMAVWDYPLSTKYTKMFESMKKTGFPISKDEALKRVRRQIPEKSETEFALIGDATEIKYLSMTDCDYVMVGDEFSRKPYAIAVQQGSPLKDQLNNAILQLLNLRELERLKNHWWYENPNRRRCSEEEENSDGISIKNIGGVFIVIFMGIILACMTLAFEYWYYRHKPHQLMKKRLENTKFNLPKVKPVHFNLKLRTGIKKDTEFRSHF